MMGDQTMLFQVDQILLSFARIDDVKIREIISYDPNKELLTELVQIFDSETTEVIKQIKTNCESNNFSDVSKLAHRLRSTSSNLGATRLSQILQRIEYMTLESEVIKSEIDFLINAAAKESISASASLHTYLTEITAL